MIKCRQCDKDLALNEIFGVRDVDLQRVGVFCREHGEIVQNNLKEKRFIEEYNGNKIYSKDGEYFPYWECSYSFVTLKDTKTRIDNPQIAVVNMNAFKTLNR